MNLNLLSDLCWYYTQELPRPADPETQQAMQDYLRLEQVPLSAMGLEFLAQYQQAYNRAYGWQDEAIFLAGTRFASDFLGLVQPQSSASAP